MSLLGAQVYANPDTSCWLSSAGGAISGPISTPDLFTERIDLTDAAGVSHARLAAPTDAVMFIQAPNIISFTKPGVGTGNTSLTLSASGANADLLTVGGTLRAAIGPVPTTLAVTNPTVITLNAPATSLTITPAYPLVTNGKYDIQITGYWSISAGVVTPAPADLAQIRVQVGSGTSPAFYDKIIQVDMYPAFANAPWTAASFQPFQARARVGGANIPNLVVTGAFTGSGTYPGGAVQLVVTTLDVQRVA